MAMTLSIVKTGIVNMIEAVKSSINIFEACGLAIFFLWDNIRSLPRFAIKLMSLPSIIITLFIIEFIHIFE